MKSWFILYKQCCYNNNLIFFGWKLFILFFIKQYIEVFGYIENEYDRFLETSIKLIFFVYFREYNNHYQFSDLLEKEKRKIPTI